MSPTLMTLSVAGRELAAAGTLLHFWESGQINTHITKARLGSQRESFFLDFHKLADDLWPNQHFVPLIHAPGLISL